MPLHTRWFVACGFRIIVSYLRNHELIHVSRSSAVSLVAMIRQLARPALLIFLLLSSAAVFAQNAVAPAAQGKAAKAKRLPLTPPASKEFSHDVAVQVLGLIRDGLHNHSPGRMLVAFDREKLPDYLAFEDQVHAYFNQYDSFRSYFRILQTSTEQNHGVVLAEWQIESSRDSAQPPQRRDAQVRFELAPGKNGWQIVDFSPRNFFQ